MTTHNGSVFTHIIKRDGGITIASLIKWAKDGGWTPTRNASPADTWWTRCLVTRSHCLYLRGNGVFAEW